MHKLPHPPISTPTQRAPLITSFLFVFWSTVCEDRIPHGRDRRNKIVSAGCTSDVCPFQIVTDRDGMRSLKENDCYAVESVRSCNIIVAAESALHALTCEGLASAAANSKRPSRIWRTSLPGRIHRWRLCLRCCGGKSTRCIRASSAV